MDEELARAAKVKALLDETGLTQEQLARHLKMSRAAVAQAVCTMRLDERVRMAMIRKGKTGWRARQKDIRRFSHLDPAVVLRELHV